MSPRTWPGNAARSPWDPKRPVAPFDANGNLLHYPAGVAEWREVEPFKAVLTLVGMRRGRSAAYAYWIDIETEARYPMFLSDLEELLTLSGVTEGYTRKALWTVRKKGQNYGLALWGLV